MARPIAPTPKVDREEAKAHLSKLADRQNMPAEERIAETKARRERIANSKWVFEEA